MGLWSGRKDTAAQQPQNQQQQYAASQGFQTQRFPYPYANPSAPVYVNAYATPQTTVHEYSHDDGEGAGSSSRRHWTLLRTFASASALGIAFYFLTMLFEAPTAMAHVKQRGDWPFILAEGAMWDPMFRDSLVLIFDCGPLSGAQGIVVNKPAMGPLPATAAAAGAGDGEASDAAPVPPAAAGPGSGPTLRGENLPTGQSWLVSQELARNPVFIGGPLALDAAEPLIVHGVPDVAGSHEALPGLFVGGDHRVLRRKVLAGACAPDEMLLVIGFSSWALGQLQSEFKRGSWAPGVIVTGQSPPTKLQKESGASVTSTSAGGERQADAHVRSLLKTFNHRALGGDAWLAGQQHRDGSDSISKFTSKDIDRGLAAMYAVEAPVSPLFGIEQVMGAVELPRKDELHDDGIAASDTGAPASADAADVSAADAPEEWARIANAAAAMAVEHAKELATRPPLFGDLQKRVAAETRQDLENRLVGRSVADAESWTSTARPLAAADYLPVWDLTKLSHLVRKPRSGE